MRQVTRKGPTTMAAATGVLAAVSGTAHATGSGAHGSATGSPGVLSGNTVQAPVHAPVNLCGNTVDVVGVLNPAMGNSCANRDGGHGAHGGGASADGHATDSPGVASGNDVQVPVDVPVNACGNSVDVIGVGNPTMGNACGNGDHHHHHPKPPGDGPGEPGQPGSRESRESPVNLGSRESPVSPESRVSLASPVNPVNPDSLVNRDSPVSPAPRSSPDTPAPRPARTRSPSPSPSPTHGPKRSSRRPAVTCRWASPSRPVPARCSPVRCSTAGRAPRPERPRTSGGPRPGGARSVSVAPGPSRFTRWRGPGG
ncbi:hypothetical protein SFUMM280S_05223 [Streptomyces fumanus]